MKMPTIPAGAVAVRVKLIICCDVCLCTLPRRRHFRIPAGAHRETILPQVEAWKASLKKGWGFMHRDYIGPGAIVKPIKIKSK